MAKKDSKKIPRNMFTRASKLLATGAGMLTKEVAGQVTARLGSESNQPMKKHQTRLDQAQQLVGTLNNLKGAAMKAGQTIAIEFSDLFPDEVVDVLRELNDSASFLPFKDIEKILIKEWGPEKFSQVKNISKEPVAAASIGQVHTCEFNGEKLACKIQYPGVAGSINSDLKILKSILAGYLKIYRKRIVLDDLFEALESTLHDEADFLREAKFATEYREAFSDDKRYRVPKIIPELTTKTVLSMTLEQGDRISDWMKTPSAQENQQAFGDAIMHLIVKEFFEQGLMQTDPNYGNFLFDVATGQIVLLDFGATKRADLKVRQLARKSLACAYDSDDQGLIDTLIEMKALDGRESDEVKRQLVMLYEKVMDMFHPEQQPFNFGNIEFLTELRESAFELIRHAKYTGPASHLLFFNRKIGGMYHLLRDLNCKIDMAEKWDYVKKLEIK